MLRSLPITLEMKASVAAETANKKAESEEIDASDDEKLSTDSKLSEISDDMNVGAH